MPVVRETAIPISRQIESFLCQQIQSGTPSPETQLPSTKDLSASLGVSRIVVAKAYAELESHALVYSKHGSGTYVGSQITVDSLGEDGFTSATDWPVWQQELLSGTWQPAYQELGRLLNPGERPRSHLRLNYAISTPDVIEEGMRWLGRALERLVASASLTEVSRGIARCCRKSSTWAQSH